MVPCRKSVLGGTVSKVYNLRPVPLMKLTETGLHYSPKEIIYYISLVLVDNISLISCTSMSLLVNSALPQMIRFTDS